MTKTKIELAYNLIFFGDDLNWFFSFLRFSKLHFILNHSYVTSFKF